MPSKLTCNVILYFDTSIMEADHFKLDTPMTYLTGKQAVPVNGIMLEKSIFDSMEISVKLAMEPSMLTDTDNLRGIDYMRIVVENESEESVTYYYFVTALQWLSTGAIQVHAKLDTLNTILPFLDFSHRTVTKRRHFERFRSVSGGYALRDVHRYDEGLYPLKYQQSILPLNETGHELVQWNLVYRNTNQPDPSEYHQINPVELHLTTDNNVEVTVNPQAINVLTISNFTGENGYDYLLKPEDVAGATFVIGGVTTPYDPDIEHYGIRKNSDGTLTLYFAYRNSGNQTWSKSTEYGTGESLTILNAPASVIHALNVWLPYVNSTYPLPYDNYEIPLTATTAQIAGIHGSYDRTDPRLIRIAKVPYAPVAIPLENSRFTIPAEWEFDPVASDLVKKDINGKFSRTVQFSVTNPIYTEMLIPFPTPDVTLERNMLYESKLLHSAFHTIKFTYDSFSVEVPYETLAEGVTIAGFNLLLRSDRIVTKYTVSTTMSGKFMFEFGAIKSVFRGTEDYPLVLTVARNNEEPVFTSAYVNYLRTGYNYDVKAKQIAASSAAANIAAGAGSGLVMGAMSGNPVGALVGAAVGGVSAAIGAAFQQINAEQSIQQKLAGARSQSVGISGSDDVDLMVGYCGNRLTLFRYDPSPETKQALFDLFFYYGYACNETGVPTHHNRYYFDFLQADAEFERTSKRNFSPIFIEDIQRKLSEGVTFIHDPLAALGALTTTRENWENDLI